MSSFIYPRQSPKPRHRSLSAAPANPGAWRYSTVSRGRFPILLPLLISTGLHYGLLAYQAPEPPPARPPQEVLEVVQIAMPKLEEEEPDKVVNLAEQEADAPPAVQVPMLADIPSAVQVNGFVQPLSYVPDVQPNLNSAKLGQIPVNISRGPGKGIEGLGKIFEVSQLDRAPTPIAQPPPAFPFNLRREATTGRVDLEFIVTANGDVVNPTVISSTHQEFSEAAIAAVLKWRFRPGVKNGRKVNTRVLAPILFSVSEEQ